jgi:hypothetical protein
MPTDIEKTESVREFRSIERGLVETPGTERHHRFRNRMPRCEWQERVPGHEEAESQRDPLLLRFALA